MNPFSFPLEIWWYLFGLCTGLTLCLIAIHYADKYDRKHSGDYLAPEDAGASPAARKHSKPPYDQETSGYVQERVLLADALLEDAPTDQEA